MNTLGERLRWLREKRQLTQKEVADRIGIREATLSRYENNKRPPNADTIIALANILGASSDFLLCLTDLDKPWWSEGNAPETMDLEDLIQYSEKLTLKGKPLTPKARKDVMYFLQAVYAMAAQEQ